jgi:hypothetical protein
MRPLRTYIARQARTPTLDADPKFVGGSKNATQNNATPRWPTHRSQATRRRRRRSESGAIQCQHSLLLLQPGTSKNAVVTEEKSKKPKEMAGKSPAQVCAEIAAINRGKALVKLGDDQAVLPWMRKPYFKTNEKDYHSTDLKSPKNNFRVQYSSKPKVRQGKSMRLANASQGSEVDAYQ